MTGTEALVASAITAVALFVAWYGVDLFVPKIETAQETLEGNTEEAPAIEVPSPRFRRGWDQMSLPVIGVVTVIDDGNPGVGLSAMQMNALGVGRGLVRLEFKGQTCEAKVWNASGPDSLKGAAEIRITNSVARDLGCGIDDEIRFVEVITRNLPVRVH